MPKNKMNNLLEILAAYFLFKNLAIMCGTSMLYYNVYNILLNKDSVWIELRYILWANQWLYKYCVFHALFISCSLDRLYLWNLKKSLCTLIFLNNFWVKQILQWKILSRKKIKTCFRLYFYPIILILPLEHLKNLLNKYLYQFFQFSWFFFTF